jgi:formate dehydrogenase beta subunit
LKPTDISAPDYFHKVVDCQWACPAHTPVPEYIRLIAAGRYSEAYMVNWVSNVFPGILGRTCDRPCEPACRRSRVEDEARDADGRERREPVAICRLKRVAADYKEDIRGLLPQPAAQKNGRRVACIGAGPASLTVARDLAPLGYEVVVYDGDRLAGGMMRTQIPKFRLPEGVIDEETGYILNLGVDFRGGQYIHSLKAVLDEGYDAVFVGCGAPRGQDLDVPGRKAAAKHIHLGIDWLANVAFGHVTSISKRVIVLGGGNTAMDCCRSARRLGGEDVKVIVRSGFEQMKASPWEKEDAMHEGIPILNNLVPKAFTHNGGRLTGVTFQKVRSVYDENGRRTLVPTGEPDPHFECDTVLVAVGQENAFPWIERDIGIEFDKWGLPKLDERRCSRRCRTSSSAATPPSGRRTSSGRWRTARGGGLDRPPAERRGHRRPAGTDDQPGVAEDGHPRLALRQRHLGRSPPARAAARRLGGAEEHQDRGRTRLRSPARLQGGAALPELRRADGVQQPLCIECDACMDICPMDCISFTHNGDEDDLRPPAGAGAQPQPGPLRLGTLKTGRVMVKDEDVCLHCGLCAERCPTGAWDMQKYLLVMTHAGCARTGASEAQAVVT